MRFQLFQHLKTKFNLTIFSLLLLTVFQIQTFAAGVVDTTFGTNGTVNFNFGNEQIVNDVDVQSDRKTVLLGSVSPATDQKNAFLARFNENGSIDTTFGNNGISILRINNRNTNLYDFEFQADGKIVAVGSHQAYDEVTDVFDFLVVRFNADGTLDTTFGDGGKVIINQNQTDNFRKLTIQPDGKIVAVGSTFETIRLLVVFRFNQNGSSDTAFANNGRFYYDLPAMQGNATNSAFLDVEVFPNGRIIAGGTRYNDRPSVDDSHGFYLVNLTANGTFIGVTENSKNIRFGSFNLNFFDAEILPDGRLLTASGVGVFISTDNSSKYFEADGTNVSLLPNGKVVVAGRGLLGRLKVFSKDKLLGTAWNIPLGKVVGQNDGKIVIVDNNILTRINSVTSEGTRSVDFDKDGKADFVVYRPNNKTVYSTLNNGTVFERTITRSATKVYPELVTKTVNETLRERSVLINWSYGNQPTDSGVFEFTNAFQFAGNWGITGDIAFGGDFDGNAQFDVGVFRPSNGTWYPYNTFDNAPLSLFQWGTLGDKPVPADYDYDGMTDYAVYRPSNGTWYIHKSSDNGAIIFQWGNSTDIPLTGDFDADGKADFTVYRTSEGKWYQYLTTEGVKITQFGLATDSPVPGDYDGDGRHDVAIYRNGNWWLLQSRDGLKVVQWGTTGDVPVSVRYDN